MAHEVRFSIPQRQLGRADIKFKVKIDGDVLGTLKVSQGALVWVPANATLGYKVSWTDFADYAVENGEYGHK